MSTPLLDCIVVAGGRGRRLGSPTPKQFLPLGPQRRPLLAVTLERLAAYPKLGRLALVVPEGWMAEVQRAGLPGSAGGHPLLLTAGGMERQDSVFNGIELLRALDPPPEWIAVHDAARPLIRSDTMEAVWSAAMANGSGAIACEPVHDTLKKIGDAGQVLTTEDRTRFVRAQTPQLFRADILWEAASTARRDGFVGSDEAMLVERRGYPIAAVPSLGPNPKITTAEDLALAEFWLARESVP